MQLQQRFQELVLKRLRRELKRISLLQPQELQELQPQEEFPLPKGKPALVNAILLKPPQELQELQELHELQELQELHINDL